MIEYIFIINFFEDININIIYYKLSQTWTSLTGTLPIIAFFWEQRESLLHIFSCIFLWWLTCTTATLYWCSTCIVARFHSPRKPANVVSFFSGRGRSGSSQMRNPGTEEASEWGCINPNTTKQTTASCMAMEFFYKLKHNLEDWTTDDMTCAYLSQIDVTDSSGVCSFMTVKWKWK